MTALSGSGPAFVYLFAESLIEGGVRGGLPQNLATQLAYATLGGAASMLGERGLSARELRAMVLSPGGPTLAGAGRARATALPRGGDHGGGDRCDGRASWQQPEDPGVGDTLEKFHLGVVVLNAPHPVLLDTSRRRRASWVNPDPSNPIVTSFAP